MRLASLVCVLLALAGISSAQDTNFPAGPQYLVTTGSPLFLRSIATPTLSLSAPPADLGAPGAESIPEPASPFVSNPNETANEAANPGPSPSGLARIFYGVRPASGESNENATDTVSEIEITSPQTPLVLPASIVDTGVTAMTDAQSLRVRGYGVPLGDTAAFWKTHKPSAARVYTNADVERLHRS
jgi:hypothetical protein